MGKDHERKTGAEEAGHAGDAQDDPVLETGISELQNSSSLKLIGYLSAGMVVVGKSSQNNILDCVHTRLIVRTMAAVDLFVLHRAA